MKPNFKTKKQIIYLDMVDFFNEQDNFDKEAFWMLLTGDDGYLPITITNGCHLSWQINESLDFFEEKDHELVKHFNNLLIKHYNLLEDEEVLFNIFW
jgi:hypothetical protein